VPSSVCLKSGRRGCLGTPQVGAEDAAQGADGAGERPSEPSLSASELKFYAYGWLMNGEASMHSPQTLALHRIITGKLLWFLGRKGTARCGRAELLAFFAHMTRGQLEPGGRWGNPQQTRS
jgi:hypothetical protein